MRPSKSSRRVCALLVGLSLGLSSQFARAEAGLEQLELGLLEHLNRTRSELGAPLLGSHRALSQVARERVAQLAGRSELDSTSAEVTDLEGRLWRLGYTPHYWRFAIVAGHLDWRRIAGTRLQPELLRLELEHVAVSCTPWAAGPERSDEGLLADPEEQTLCLIMVGERRIRFQQRVAEPLRDVAAVRRAVISEVNRIREARGLAPLEGNVEADAAAQRHAEDMLNRNFYSHRNPDGMGPRQRAVEAGFAARGISENIAKVVTSPADAVARWMSSSGHRRNILRRDARHHGLGVAIGIEDGEVVGLWCQLISN